MRIKNILRKISHLKWRESLDVAFDRRKVLHWSDDPANKNNFGDALNPFLFNAITGNSVGSRNNIVNPMQRNEYYFIGSILDNLRHRNAIICGAGFQYASATLQRMPKKVIAVRGPRTRKKLIELGINCPQLYCDPALTLPIFMDGSEQTSYDVGIVPHYVDKTSLSHTSIKDGNLSYKIIDIENPIRTVVNEITSCKHIISSSLHGIIVAHAYGVPSAWLRLSDKVLGGEFKFLDYYESVGLPLRQIAPIGKIDIEACLDKTSCPVTEPMAIEFVRTLQSHFLLSIDQ